MLAIVYTVFPVIALLFSFWEVLIERTVPVEKEEIAVVSARSDAAEPILYPMTDSSGNYITEEIDISDFNTKQMVNRVSDIIQGQYWAESMQMMDLLKNIDQVFATNPV